MKREEAIKMLLDTFKKVTKLSAEKTEIKSVDGKSYTVDALEVGSAIYEGDAPYEGANLVLEDGTELVIEAGMIKEIKPVAEPVEAAAEIELPKTEEVTEPVAEEVEKKDEEKMVELPEGEVEVEVEEPETEEKEEGSNEVETLKAEVEMLKSKLEELLNIVLQQEQAMGEIKEQPAKEKFNKIEVKLDPTRARIEKIMELKKQTK